ncbi:Hypothetical predicted protein [Olea europaea subsp. europaea]|uniref:Uncharacterized protein n=1 Tax=Olea europaea subsp. europaea TaxID=158383 RepID=A0A8S0S8Z4_OLEEU|nr:Hypothetical predicted protein [Olea europaea subsp. europaea]
MEVDLYYVTTVVPTLGGCGGVDCWWCATVHYWRPSPQQETTVELILTIVVGDHTIPPPTAHSGRSALSLNPLPGYSTARDSRMTIGDLFEGPGQA